jgi:hypothetical protein
MDLPLPTNVRCYAIAGSLGDDGITLKGRLLGDGLVPVDSALGVSADPARQLAFTKVSRWIATGVSHMQLLSNAKVYAKLRGWLR